MMLLLGGCPAAASVQVSEVMNYAQCQGLQERITRITFAELAQVRGVQLLSPPPDQAPAAQSSPADDALLLAVFNGRQSTPGYGLILQSVEERDANLILNYTWQEPPADALQAQVITTPCSVVQVSGLAPGKRVEVLLDGAPFADAQDITPAKPARPQP
jgi:hypothetical protein